MTYLANSIPTLSIVFAVYNEAESIESVIKEFYEEIGTKIPVEIIVAEDGSTDGTKDILKRLSKELPIRLNMKDDRRGYLGAIKDGLNDVRTPYAIFIDSDGQCTAKDFWKFWEHKDKCDMVLGWRSNRKDVLYRKVLSGGFQNIIKILFDGVPFHDLSCPYMLIKHNVIHTTIPEVKHLKYSCWPEFVVRVYRKGYNIIEVPIDHRERLAGETQVYKPTKLLKIMISQFIGAFSLYAEL